VAHVEFTPHLKRFFPALAPLDVVATNVAELVRELDRVHPGIGAYVVDERGALRKHVVIFVDASAVRDRNGLSDPLAPASRVHIFQALSGG